MRAKFFLLMSVLLLSACSEKVEQTTEKAIKIENEVDINQEESQQIKANLEEEQTEVGNEEDQEQFERSKVNIQEEPSDNEETILKQSDEPVLTVPVTEQTDFYSYYVSNGISKEENEENIVEDLNENSIVYESLTDSVIELPTLENNEEAFKDTVKSITLADLEAISAIRYMEEPATLGNLLIIDMSILKSHYLGKSYSLTFNEEEYGMVISKEESDVGVILMRNTKDLIEDIKSSSVINIMN